MTIRKMASGFGFSTLSLLIMLIMAWAPAAQAAPVKYFVTDGANLFINDPGVGNVVETTTSGKTTYTLDTTGQAKYEGHTTYKMRINGGSDCLAAVSNDLLYDAGCNTNGTNQQFYIVDHFIYSVGWANFYGEQVALQAISSSNGADIFGALNPSSESLNQWTFTAAE